MSVVYARETAFVGRVRVKKGDAWDSESDVVKNVPSLFSDEPQAVKGRVEKSTRPVSKKASKRAEAKSSKDTEDEEPEEDTEDDEEEQPGERVERATRAPGERRGPRGPRGGTR